MKKGYVKKEYFGLEVGQQMYFQVAGIFTNGFQMYIYDSKKRFVTAVFNEELFNECIDKVE